MCGNSKDEKFLEKKKYWYIFLRIIQMFLQKLFYRC